MTSVRELRQLHRGGEDYSAERLGVVAEPEVAALAAEDVLPAFVLAGEALLVGPGDVGGHAGVSIDRCRGHG